MKIFIKITAAMLVLLLLCSCKKEPEMILKTEEPPIKESFSASEDFAEEFLPEKDKPRKEETGGKTAQEKILEKTEEPFPEEFSALIDQKTEEAKIAYKSWDEVEKNFPEYDAMLSYFGSGLSENYDEENYVFPGRLVMLFDHAYENEKAAGRIEKDEWYPDYPAEFVEELLGKYYLFSAEEIKALSGKYGYDAENDTYNMEGGYGGAYPIPRVTAVIDNGETIDLYVDLHSAVDDYHLEQSSVLTIKPRDDGSWKYISNRIYFVRNYD